MTEQTRDTHYHNWRYHYQGAGTSRPQTRDLAGMSKAGLQVRPFGGAPYKNMNAAG
jgi:hypothetical protein